MITLLVGSCASAVAMAGKARGEVDAVGSGSCSAAVGYQKTSKIVAMVPPLPVPWGARGSKQRKVGDALDRDVVAGFGAERAIIPSSRTPRGASPLP